MKKPVKIKPVSTSSLETYVISIDEYKDFIKTLNKDNKSIYRMHPSYVAGYISDSFIIDVTKASL
jgi:hypothetical protein